MNHPARAGAAATVLLTAAALAGCAAGVGTPPSTPAAPAANTTTAATQTVAPVVAPTPTSPVAGWPQTISIPKLAVTAPIAGPCGTTPTGSIEPPRDIHAVCVTGRTDLEPDGTGTSTITGHTTRAASVGALEQISQLTAGDTFTAADRTWRVVEVGTYPATALPDRLFTVDGPRRIILGTCHLTPAVLAGAPYTDTDIAVAVPS